MKKKDWQTWGWWGENTYIQVMKKNAMQNIHGRSFLTTKFVNFQ